MRQAYPKAGAQEDKLKTMAKAVITDQQKGIQQLQVWLKKTNENADEV